MSTQAVTHTDEARRRRLAEEASTQNADAEAAQAVRRRVLEALSKALDQPESKAASGTAPGGTGTAPGATGTDAAAAAGQAAAAPKEKEGAERRTSP